MIKEFVDIFMKHKDELRVRLATYKGSYGWSINYYDIVKEVIYLYEDEDLYPCPDFENIHEIDDGDYQGTLLYIISEKGYQPDDYWYVKIGYGSCSCCDTLLSITEFRNNDNEILDDLMTLALHIVQGIKKMD